MVSYTGLFGKTSVSSILSNFSLTNVEITGVYATGAVVGENGIIKNITVKGNVYSKEDSKGRRQKQWKIRDDKTRTSWRCAGFIALSWKYICERTLLLNKKRRWKTAAIIKQDFL